MPKYHSREIAGWKIDVMPFGKWRRIFKALHIEPPYFVGDKIKVNFYFQKNK
jgi:hypothetical protein